MPSPIVKDDPRELPVEDVEAAAPESGKNKKRRIVITTDGAKWKVESTECSALELKAICQEVLKKLGG